MNEYKLSTIPEDLIDDLDGVRAIQYDKRDSFVNAIVDVCKKHGVDDETTLWCVYMKEMGS